MLLKNHLLLTSLFTLLSIFTSSQAIADSSNIYKVNNVGQRGVLNLREAPSLDAKVLLQLPYNARWISKIQNHKHTVVLVPLGRK